MFSLTDTFVPDMQTNFLLKFTSLVTEFFFKLNPFIYCNYLFPLSNTVSRDVELFFVANMSQSFFGPNPQPKIYSLTLKSTQTKPALTGANLMFRPEQEPVKAWLRNRWAKTLFAKWVI